jgi:hypothetical protein
MNLNLLTKLFLTFLILTFFCKTISNELEEYKIEIFFDVVASISGIGTIIMALMMIWIFL